MTVVIVLAGTTTVVLAKEIVCPDEPPTITATVEPGDPVIGFVMIVGVPIGIGVKDVSATPGELCVQCDVYDAIAESSSGCGRSHSLAQH